MGLKPTPPWAGAAKAKEMEGNEVKKVKEIK